MCCWQTEVSGWFCKSLYQLCSTSQITLYQMFDMKGVQTVSVDWSFGKWVCLCNRMDTSSWEDQGFCATHLDSFQQRHKLHKDLMFSLWVSVAYNLLSKVILQRRPFQQQFRFLYRPVSHQMCQMKTDVFPANRSGSEVCYLWYHHVSQGHVFTHSTTQYLRNIWVELSCIIWIRLGHYEPHNTLVQKLGTSDYKPWLMQAII